MCVRVCTECRREGSLDKLEQKLQLAVSCHQGMLQELSRPQLHLKQARQVPLRPFSGEITILLTLGQKRDSGSDFMGKCLVSQRISLPPPHLRRIRQ